MPPHRTPPTSTSRAWWIAAALLTVFAVAAVDSLRRDAATYDETAHLPAGLTYLERMDFRMNPEHPPLSKVWAALPLRIGRLAHGDYRSPYWTGVVVSRAASGRPARSKADQWRFGYEMLNGPLAQVERLRPQRLLVPARCMMVLLGVALGVIVYTWSRECWGRTGALLSTFFFALSPTMLAHARLVTTDLPVALGMVAALWTFRRFQRAPGWGSAACVALATSLALSLKFSALLLGPLLTLAGVAWLLRQQHAPGERRRRAGWLLRAGLLTLVAAFTAVWALYGFRFAATPDPGYVLDWEIVGLRDGLLAELIRRALSFRVLPEAWLYGLAYFAGGAARRVAFLNGESSLVGWWYYFPEAFLLKTPPATLIGLGWLAALARRLRRNELYEVLYILLALAFYMLVSVASNLNIGHRHLTPIYPLLFVLLGGLPRVIGAARHGRALVAGTMALYLVSFVAATPRYLSYFNFAAGGPAGGWRYLLDSNIDWGQDLIRLRRFMDRAGVDRIHLAYFGTADPAAYGIRYDKVLMVHDYYPERSARRPRAGELVAVSVNLLQGLYFDEDEALATYLMRQRVVGPERIHEWLDLRDRLSAAGKRHPALDRWLVEGGLVSAERVNEIRAGFPTTWFASLRDGGPPLARAGDSILVYRVP